MNKYETLKERLRHHAELPSARILMRDVEAIIADIDAMPDDKPFSCNVLCDDCGMSYNIAHNPKGCPVCSIGKQKPPAQPDALVANKKLIELLHEIITTPVYNQERKMNLLKEYERTVGK